MMSEPLVVLDAGEPGRSWVRRSLAGGHAIAEAVAGRVDLESGATLALVPRGMGLAALRDPERGGITREAPAGSLLDDLVARLWPAQGFVLLVEDDLRRVGDPALRGREDAVVLPPNRVVHWMELGQVSLSGVHRFLRTGSSGYPTNAFVVETSVAELLAVAQERPGDLADWVGGRLAAVIVAAFDAESWVVWLRGLALTRFHGHSR